jgi:uncharacterized protein involved in exopolysaccharide biosynthesis
MTALDQRPRQRMDPVDSPPYPDSEEASPGDDTLARGRSEGDDTVSLLDLLNVLARRKTLIAATTIAAAIGVLGFSILSLTLPPRLSPLPNYYRAEALVLISGDSVGGASQLLSDSPLSSLVDLGQIGGRSYGDLAVRLLGSRSVLDAVAGTLDLEARLEDAEHPVPAARELLLSMSTFELDSATGVLTIAAEDTDRVFAQHVANSLVQELESRFAAIGLTRNTSQAHMLERKLEEVESRIGELESQLIDFQRRHGVLTFDGLAQERVEVLGRLRSDLLLKDVEIRTYRDLVPAGDPMLRRMIEERRSLEQLLADVETGSDSLAGVMPSQQELPELAIQYARLQRDLAVQTEIYAALSGQYEATRLSLEANQEIFQILERAEVPEQKAGPSRSMICVIVTITAFFLAVFLAFVLEYFSSAAKDPEERHKLEELRRNLRFSRQKGAR